ncbi:MAG: hypothetical protein KAT70_06605, partial [Thermoplasmata archaeon]|nr:hypothetical protein [Thermoplasmata archaeon]
MTLEPMVAVWIRGDNVVLARETEYAPLKAGEGTADPLDVLDLLAQRYDRFLLLDLDGIERGSPQLELFQDCSEEHEIWV